VSADDIQKLRKVFGLQALLTPFAVTTPGVFLYYPGKRQVLPKLCAFVEHVSYRSGYARGRTTARKLRKINHCKLLI
jgi:hypothetical protein